jgi:orotate phosphoribosyltransferase-like protein
MIRTLSRSSQDSFDADQIAQALKLSVETVRLVIAQEREQEEAT